MKTDMVYLAKGGFWLTLGQVVATASGLLLVIGFANLVPKDVYGNYKLILSLAGMLAAFTLTGMGTAVTQAVARGADGVFRTAFWVELRWSALIVLAALAGAIYYFVNGNRVIAISLLIVGVCAPIIESTSLYGDFLNGKKDFRTGALYGVIRGLVPATFILATICFTQNVILIVLAYFLSHAATSGALYLLVLKKYRPARETDHSNTAYGKHITLTNAISIVASNLDKVLVFHYLGAVQLAVYGIAFSLPAQMKILQKMVGTLAFPKLSSASLQTVRSEIHHKAQKLLIGSVIVIAIYIAAAPLIFRLVFPQYIDAVPLSQALALAYVFIPAVLYSQAIFSKKRQREIYMNKVLAAAARILLLLVLLPTFGIWGAVYAYFLANAVSFAISFTIFMRMREGLPENVSDTPINDAL